MTKNLVVRQEERAIRNNEPPNKHQGQCCAHYKCRVIDDFINCTACASGRGIFSGNLKAVKYALTISANQKHKYQRLGIVPAALYAYLKGIKAIPDVYVPEKNRTIENLLDLLWQTTRQGNGNRDEADALRNEILKEQMPWIKMQFGSAQHIMQKGELYNVESKRTA